MKNKIAINIINGIILTAIILITSFLIMLFSSGEDGYRSILFNSVFFESTTLDNNTIDLVFGFGPNFLMVALFLLVSIFFISLNVISVFEKYIRKWK